MKKFAVFLLLLSCVCLLMSCSVKNPPPLETVAATAQTGSVTEATESAPTETSPIEPEETKDLVMSESYYFSLQDGDTYYQRYLTLYPNSCFYDARWSGDASCGSYTLDDQGRIVMEIGGEHCVFKKTEYTLILESGSFDIYSETGCMDVTPGKVSKNRYESTLRDGIYMLDTSGYDFTFGEVLLDIDLAEMIFTLKCFDGSVVSGTLSFEEDLLICTHAGGTMRLRISNHPMTGSLEKTSASVEKGSVSTDQLMFYPPSNGVMNYTFCYARDQAQEIVFDPQVIPLDSHKHLFRKIYQFRCDASEDSGGRRCVFNIYHYPLEEKWAFEGAFSRTDVTAEENPDGSIVFTLNGKTWNFHREGDFLYYDSGNSLTAGVWNVETERYLKADVPEGAMFHAYNEDYVYDALYILPAQTIEEAYASIQIDTKNQNLRIRCSDGRILEGAYTYEGNYINFPVEVVGLLGPETANVELFPHGHCLSVRNEGVRDQWELVIGPGGISDSFDFLPVIGIPPKNSAD